VLEMPIQKRVDLSGKSVTALTAYNNSTEVIVNPQYVFDNKLFYLKGPQGSLILPEFWSQTLQPGLDVQLQFEDFIRWPGKPLSSESSRRVVVTPSKSKLAGDVDDGGQQSSRLSKLWKR
jgi:hypothetical protein